ncbi:hypothetical protein ACFVFT_35550 [Streptomyces tendae]|uniref:hypothetical protein n=1 Tax=Streptomyces tendae TaxID=1932 RepID=UPI00367B39C9
MSGCGWSVDVALPVSNIVKADPWAGYEWVVWQVEVDDPEQRISEPYNTAGVAFLLAEDSRKEMVDFVARLGCVYEGCRDDGTSGSDDDPCYTWWFRWCHRQPMITLVHRAAALLRRLPSVSR